MQIIKALEDIQLLFGKGNIEIVTADGHRTFGVVHSVKTEALTMPNLNMEIADGTIVEIPFASIAEIRDHNGTAN